MRVALLLLMTTSCVTIPERARSLTEGGDLHAWFTMTGAGSVHFSDNMITLKDGPGALVIALTETDYRVRVDVMLEEGSNSGVFVRSKSGIWFPDGVEVQINHADRHNPTGSIYGRAKSGAPLPKFGEWFTLEVIAQGSRVESFVNGLPGAHVDDAPPDGPLFALQAHYPGSVVHFKNLSIEKLQ